MSKNSSSFNKVLFRSNGKNYCQVGINVSNGGILSLNIAKGNIVNKKDTEKTELDFWTNILSNDKAQIICYNEQQGTQYYSVETAAQGIVQSIMSQIINNALKVEGDIIYAKPNDLVITYNALPNYVFEYFPALKRFSHLVGRIINKNERKRLLKMCNDTLLREHKKDLKDNTSEPLMVDDPNPTLGEKLSDAAILDLMS